MTTTELIDVVARVCRRLGKLELTHAALGPVSYRLGDSDTMLIKGKGHAVLLTICDKEILPIYGAYWGGFRLAIEGVATYPRSVTISDDRLGEEFATFMGARKVALMRGHGVSVVGSGVEDATVRVMELNQLVTMTYKAYVLGTPRPIPDEDIQSYVRPPDPNRRRGSAGGDAGVLASWRYYRSLADED